MINPAYLYKEYIDEEKKWGAYMNNIYNGYLQSFGDSNPTPEAMARNTEVLADFQFKFDKFLEVLNISLSDELGKLATEDIRAYNNVISAFIQAPDPYTKQVMKQTFLQALPTVKAIASDYEKLVLKIISFKDFGQFDNIYKEDKQYESKKLPIYIKNYATYKLMQNNIENNLFNYILPNDIATYFNTVIDSEIPYFKNKERIVQMINKDNDEEAKDEYLAQIFEDENGYPPTEQELAVLRGRTTAPTIVRDEFQQMYDPYHLNQYLPPQFMPNPSAPFGGPATPTGPSAPPTPPTPPTPSAQALIDQFANLPPTNNEDGEDEGEDEDEDEGEDEDDEDLPPPAPALAPASKKKYKGVVPDSGVPLGISRKGKSKTLKFKDIEEALSKKNVEFYDDVLKDDRLALDVAEIAVEAYNKGKPSINKVSRDTAFDSVKKFAKKQISENPYY